MNDQSNMFFAPNLETLSESAQASFHALSNTYAAWLKNANRMQAEAIRFVSDRFNKDVQMLSRFGNCKKPEDVLRLQSELVTQLMGDYSDECAKWIALLGDAAKDATDIAGAEAG